MGFSNSGAFCDLIKTIGYSSFDDDAEIIYESLIDTLSNLDFDVWDELEGENPIFDEILHKKYKEWGWYD